ncbi:hypothetical protein HFD92_09835 [Pantoea sp. EKM101V]|uniref:hypothetical protein n=1 Tax=Pantoea sp. EKM101V TaxID=1683695 RepID=UPI00142DC8E7|nr:hypothetical protein [Pantoea sp. EKM101V]KAF6665081.1 hypothetical protein HFD92_09835 [Pantoea sp. EKM101V]
MKGKRYSLLFVSLFLTLCWGNVNASGIQTSSGLWRDAALDLRLRNHWKYLKENEAQPTAVHNAWGQAATFDFRSGYQWDLLGFDATYTRAVRLGASDYFSTRGLLYDSGGNMEKRDAHGFSKFSQRYLKLKLGNRALRFEGKAGWQELKNIGVLTTTDRLSRNSYAGYSGAVTWQNARLDLAMVNKAIRHDSGKTLALQTQARQKIDAIYTAALSYKDSGHALAYAFGEAERYQRRHVIEAGYSLSPHWSLASQIYGSQALEKYKSMPASKRTFDHQAWHYVGEAIWKQGAWTQRLAAGWTSAPKKQAVGYYARPLTKNTRGRFTSLTSAGKDYMRDRELALVSLSQYEIAKGISSGIQLNYGQFHYRNNLVRTGEVSLINQFSNQHPSFKNLTLFTLTGYGWSYKNSKETPRLNSQGKFQRSRSLSAEVVIQYKFNLF